MLDDRLQQALDTWQDWAIDSGDRPQPLKRINGGLTNRSFYISANNKYYTLRLNHSESGSLGIKRAIEYKVLDVLAPINIAPKLIYGCPNYRFSVFEYIDGRVWGERDLQSATQRQKLMRAVKKYQSVHVDIPQFDYVHHLNQYWCLFRKRRPHEAMTLLRPWFHFKGKLSLYQRLKKNRVLTHHDLVPQNIIETENGIRIIDWEYSGLGYLGLDEAYIHLQKHREKVPVRPPSREMDLHTEIIQWLEYLWYRIR